MRADLVVVGSGLLRPDHRRAGAAELGRRSRSSTGATTSAATRTARTSRDRDRGAPLRRAPVPHVEPAGVGVRQPLHRRSPTTCTASTRSTGRGVPAADQPRHDQPVLPRRPRPTRRGRSSHEQAGELDAGRRRATSRRRPSRSIGRPLYEAFIRDYTAKQWQTDPRTCPPRSSAGSRCATPTTTATSTTRGRACRRDGYTAWLERMADHPRIEVHARRPTSSTSAAAEQAARVGQVPIVYTGPVDRYFDYAEGELSLAHARLRAGGARRSATSRAPPVMNYADADVPYTRIHEFRHFHPERRPTPPTRPSSCASSPASPSASDEPYYPVNTAEDRARLLAYRELAEGEQGVLFGGRLGTYQYLDMHMAIGSALTLVDNELDACSPRRAAPRRPGDDGGRRADPRRRTEPPHRPRHRADPRVAGPGGAAGRTSDPDVLPLYVDGAHVPEPQVDEDVIRHADPPERPAPRPGARPSLLPARLRRAHVLRDLLQRLSRVATGAGSPRCAR